MTVSEFGAVYLVMLLVSAQLGLDTYAGFASLVSGWGNEVLLVSPPRPLILGPCIKSIGEPHPHCDSRQFSHS
jgi:hypothetical protein